MRHMTIKLCVLTLASFVFLPLSTLAQETAFGKNKVVYRDFTWQYIQSHHFDVYFYDDQYNLAKYATESLEQAYETISDELDYSLRSRIPVFIYLSPNDFQTTNITAGTLPEGVNGFTEVFKKRVVVHFNGSYADFHHLLHHELVHAVTFDLLFGSSLSSLISRGRFFNMPLWFAEGYAEYSSRGHWFYQSDMISRDATINNYLRPPGYMGILAYTVGAGLVRYIADTYGEEKLGEILRKGKVHLTMEKAVKAALGVSMEKLWSDYTLTLKQRYWPDIALRKGPNKIAKQLTHHGKDGSYFNEKPAYSPQGGQIAVFSDRSDYIEIFLISDIDGKVIKKLTKASRSGDLESLHSYFSGITFSPDGDSICFVAKSDGADALFFMDVDKKKTYRKKRIQAYGLLSPVWSPDGSKVAFSALMNGRRDLFMYDLRLDQLIRLTDDLHDDRDASWLRDGTGLVFSSDRPHPDNNVERDVTFDTTGAFVDEDGSPLGYGGYNLFTYAIGDGAITPLPVGEGNNKEPAVSPDGKKICFVSNRNGIDNLYLHFIDSTGSIAITDLLTGAGSPSWAPSGKEIAFSSFNAGGFDVFILKEVLPAGIAGDLVLTDFYRGAYDPSNKMFAHAGVEIDTTAHIWSPATLGWAADADSGAGGISAVQSLLANGLDSSEVIDATESGVTDEGDYVHVSVAKSDDSTSTSGVDEEVEDIFSSETEGPIDALLTEVPDADLVERRGYKSEPEIKEPEGIRDPDGEYRVKPYKTKFTTDLVAFGGNYDTFLGTRLQSFFSFSDYLGEQQIYIIGDGGGSLDQLSLQTWYFNSSRRTRMGFGLFHSKNFYANDIGFSENNRLIPGSLNRVIISDRFYGLSTFASRPFSLFSRFELSASFIMIDRDYIDDIDPRIPHSTKATLLSGSYTHDNVLWGPTGPNNGSRSKLSMSVAKDFFSDSRLKRATDDNGFFVVDPVSRQLSTEPADNLSYFAAEFDHRRYWHINRAFSTAFRITAGGSFGSTPKQYFLGGTTNWVGNRVVDAEVFEVENLYFSDIVTPLRGRDYYELSGNRYFLSNFEFRFPLIDYLQLHFPLPLVLAQVQGAAFFDIGAVWTDDDFKFATSQNGPTRLANTQAGFGWGFRMNLGFLLLRYDMAWQTDLATINSKPKQYFSLGADF